MATYIPIPNRLFSHSKIKMQSFDLLNVSVILSMMRLVD